jgi:hypothetical protein
MSDVSRLRPVDPEPVPEVVEVLEQLLVDAKDQGAEIKWFWLAGKNHENEIPVSKTELEQRAIAGGVARSFYQLQGSTRGKDGE